MAETTQTGYGKKRGSGTPAENQQPCDPITHQYVEGSVASSSPSEETSSLQNEQPPHSDGGKPDVKREMPKWLKNHLEVSEGENPAPNALSDEEKEKFRQSITSSYEDVLGVAPKNLVDAIDAFWDKIPFGVEMADRCCNSVSINGRRDAPTVFISYLAAINGGTPVNTLEVILSHETGHFIDYMALTYALTRDGIYEDIFDETGAPCCASNYIPIGENGETMLDFIQEELGSERASKAIRDFVEEAKAKAIYEGDISKEDALFLQDAEKKLKDELRSKFPNIEGSDIDLLSSVLKSQNKYAWKLADALIEDERKEEILDYARGIVDREDVARARDIAVKKGARKARMPFEYAMELSKNIGRLNDIYQASPRDPAERGRSCSGLTFGHGKSYFQSDSMCATETFANICAIVCYYKDQEELLRRIAPKTMKAFDDLLAMATEYARDSETIWLVQNRSN